MALAEIDVTPNALPLDSIICGDALAVLRTLPDNSIDAIVTDPPYGLGTPPDMTDVLRAWLAGEAYTPRGRGFMGKAWDAFVPGPEYWRECARVLKPGGHLLAFAGTRTWDVMGLALRLAGLEIRDTLQWVYGSGFPKSLDVGKQFDKMAGAQRKAVGARIYADGKTRPNQWTTAGSNEGWKRPAHAHYTNDRGITAPATDAARQWDGYGTALKPAWEPVILCRKPLSERNVAANVLRWGTGALNIDGSRVNPGAHVDGGGTFGGVFGNGKPANHDGHNLGRWPANLLLSHAPECGERGCSLWCPIRALDAQSGIRTSGKMKANTMRSARSMYGQGNGCPTVRDTYGDTGGASRYFTTFAYVPKASRAERNRGCEKLPQVAPAYGSATGDGLGRGISNTRQDLRHGNGHPTVKPLALMSWLITLITPPGGIVLDPFAGSGSTLVAAKAGGWRYIGIEKEPEYVAIARSRVQAS